MVECWLFEQGKSTKVSFDFRKILRKEENVKKNYFFMFNCLIKNLCCVWFSKNTNETKKYAKKNHFHMFDCLLKKFKEK